MSWPRFPGLQGPLNFMQTCVPFWEGLVTPFSHSETRLGRGCEGGLWAVVSVLRLRARWLGAAGQDCSTCAAAASRPGIDFQAMLRDASEGRPPEPPAVLPSACSQVRAGHFQGMSRGPVLPRGHRGCLSCVPTVPSMEFGNRAR